MCTSYIDIYKTQQISISDNNILCLNDFISKLSINYSKLCYFVFPNQFGLKHVTTFIIDVYIQGAIIVYP